MPIFDWLSGTKRPAADTVPVTAAEMRGRLLSLNDASHPWRVVEGASDIELVAEWRIEEPGWGRFFSSRTDRVIKILMRLDEGRREVRATDQQWVVSWQDGLPRLLPDRSYQRGTAISQKATHWTYEVGEDGKRRRVKSFEFDTADLKDPLRDATTRAGWTWKGRLRR